MKFKLFIWTVFVMAAIAAVGFWHHRQNSTAFHTAPAVRVQPLPVPAKPIFIHRAKMITVARLVNKPVQMAIRHGWSDVELIADTKAEYAKRLDAIGRLPAKLTAVDWIPLKNFLLTPNPSDSGQQSQVIKNKLMDTLCALQPPPNDLDDVLTGMFQNLLQDEVIRDYAVQHLATLDQALAENGGQDVSRQEKADQEVLWNALTETGDSIAGTALLGLLRLSEQQDAGIDQSKIASSALQMAQDTASGELSQITAYQVCAQLNVQDALPAIESAARSGQTISVQISAIGALGLLGGANDLPLLRNLLTNDQERLQLPVQTAINRIEQRINQQTQPQSS